mmetsp:Transcript_12371/g.12460  ORF Transcript_12371/g.12460 Transcript_12371/m.12460 type:complete len:483 (-) Transcript_12371:148-1596(-)|eukprot:CAMPEP_0182428690 /NCGR_PEP_ID=MMETSP1167-20130531/23209_1 /TAXON_ID=2988 /ORGANISM="Mallomonas Sp, Strain CCMP3275" /LENGTH=482 /DNA_ID=CAMNT_0024611723 /DNA_START=50 /DNA_END=1498 /DNA_ORIENTATION=+
MAQRKALTYETISENVKTCRYDIRGEIYLAAVKRTQEGKEVIYTNVGNPHQLGQTPISFGRQVLSLLMAPFLLDHPLVTKMYPSDVIARARTYLANIQGGLGAYSDSRGNPYIRKEIAAYINKVSGVTPPVENIFVSNGASESVRLLLNTMIRGPGDGVLVPIPQYPLYSAAIALYGGQLVPYFLDEENVWALDIPELERALREAQSKGICVRGLVFINPGNPTGACLTEPNLQDLVRFCCDNRLVMMADEVYQENIYMDKPFIPARKVLNEMPEPYRSNTELASVHSASKGAYGECGMRGGYVEMHNFDPRVVNEIYKIASINLAPNVVGQVAIGLMVNPPKPGDESYPQFKREKCAQIDSLKRRALMLTDAFNSMEGVECQDAEGAMYAFPRITLPPAAMEAAKAANKPPDVFYCLELLNETGISCVPGSGFRQKEGTYHFRTTILPLESKVPDIIARFKKFHACFMRKYGGRGGGRSRL